MDVLVEAFEKSKGKTVDLVIEHEEAKGLSPEMFDWWLFNQDKEDRYHTWYPKDHVSCKWEIPPGKNGPAGSLCVVVESMGEFPASPLRIRAEDPAPEWSSISDAKDRRVAWIHEVIEKTPTGVKMHSLFRLPAQTPKKFLEAMRRHNEEEMARLVEILPGLYRKAVGGNESKK
jgi:hypothetical protein